MVKKIGNSIRAFLIIMTFCVYSDSTTISLSVKDRNGQRVTEVQVGVPFYLIVKVAGDTQNLPTPTLTNVDSSYIKGKSVSQGMSIINGALSTNNEYTYTLILTQEGEYTLGPAVGEMNGQRISSEPITIKASYKTTVEVDKQKVAFATLFFTPKEVFCNQPVECTVRFYYSLDGVRLEGIAPLEFQDFIVQPLSSPRSGVETIQGVQYRFLEWKTTVCPTKPGTLTVTPVAMRYIQPHHRRSLGHGLFGNFFDVLGGFEEEKETFTNSAQLVVQALPEHVPPVQAVGNFESIHLKVNNTTVNVGEGMVASLEITGEGNLFALSHPSLVLPSGCTCYEGNAVYHDTNIPPSKSFEYVIQAHKAGNYVIPAQKFIFFNPTTREYTTVESEPIAFTVENKSEVASSTSLSNNTPLQIVDEKKIEDELTILTHGSWKASSKRYIGWTWFFIMSVLPFLFILTQGVYNFYKHWYQKGALKRRYETAFKRTRKYLKNARRKKQYGHVYSIFIHLFADRFQKEPQEINEYMIEEWLKEHVSAIQLAQWRLFYVYISEVAFAYTTEESDSIFTQAFHWISILERVL